MCYSNFSPQNHELNRALVLLLLELFFAGILLLELEVAKTGMLSNEHERDPSSCG